MTYETITFEMRGNVAWICLNRPSAFNALDIVMARELLDGANRCAADRSVRAVVLTGSGERAFCAGGDVPSFVANAGRLDTHMREMTASLHMAVSRFAWMRAPLIAAVNGVAAGAGLSLVACCDLAVAADHATFTSAYTRIGLTPDGSSTYYLSRILGTRRAMELYVTNRTLSAAEALDWGLLNRVVPAAQLAETAGALADEIARGPTEAHGGVKELLLHAPNETLESQLERETRMIVRSGMTQDAREGVRAFIEKRKPVFRGE